MINTMDKADKKAIGAVRGVAGIITTFIIALLVVQFLVACVALNIWLFRLGALIGIIGLNVTPYDAVKHGEPGVFLVARAVEAELDAAVRQALGVHPRAGAGGVEQVDRHLLEHAGADPAEHVVGAALLDDDGVDAGPVQQGAEQEAGGAGADDGDLCFHVSGSWARDGWRGEVDRGRRRIRQYGAARGACRRPILARSQIRRHRQPAPRRVPGV